MGCSLSSAPRWWEWGWCARVLFTRSPCGEGGALPTWRDTALALVVIGQRQPNAFCVRDANVLSELKKFLQRPGLT